jgi:hypothetical protein
MHQAYRKIAVLQTSVLEEMESIPVELSIRTVPSEEDEPTLPLTDEERFKLKVAQINIEMLAHTVNSFKESTQKIFKDSMHVGSCDFLLLGCYRRSLRSTTELRCDRRHRRSSRRFKLEH